MRDEGKNGFDTVGVGRFAKDIGTLALPMSLVAAGFGLWMNAKLSDFRALVQDTVDAHARNESQLYVGAKEFEAYKRLVEERHEQERKDSEEQMRQIRKNTVLLERIAVKVGVQRQGSD